MICKVRRALNLIVFIITLYNLNELLKPAHCNCFSAIFSIRRAIFMPLHLAFYTVAAILYGRQALLLWASMTKITLGIRSQFGGSRIKSYLA
jgi:hypothetical protein